jgi:hypothetical protein
MSDAQPDIFTRLLDWGWALVVGAVGVIWKMLNGRVNKAEEAVDKLSSRMDFQHDKLMARIEEFENQSRVDRHQFRDAMQTAFNQQSVTNIEVARQIGKLAGRMKED